MGVNTQKTGKKETILVAGCGKLGGWIAGNLSERGCEVMIIDQDRNAFSNLPDSFGGFMITGDATDVSFLKSQELEDVFMVVATTGNDNVNSMIGQIAKQILNIKKVIVRFDNSENRSLVDEMGIDVIAPFDLSAQAFNSLTGEYFID